MKNLIILLFFSCFVLEANIGPFPGQSTSPSSSSGGGSGIQSINGNTNTAQTIVGSGGTSVSSVGGTTTISSTATSPGGSTTQIQYNSAGSFAGSSKFTIDTTNGNITSAPTGALTTGFSVDLSGASAYTTAGINLTLGTLPSSGSILGERIIATGNTASGQDISLSKVIFNGGTYTSSSRNIGYNSFLNVTNDDTSLTPATNGTGVIGFFGISSNSNNTASSYGGVFTSVNGNKNVGVEGYAYQAQGSTPQTYGGRFIATQANSAQSVGVWARIYATDGATAEGANPGISSALVADNGNTTGNIFTAMDNNSSLLQVKDGGTVIFGSENTGANATLLYGRYMINPKENDAGNSSTAININLQTGSSQKITLTGNATIVLGNPQTGGSYVLRLVQDATGTRTVTWPAAVKWPGGVAPTLTTTANKIDLINLYYDGTSYYGSFSLNY